MLYIFDLFNESSNIKNGSKNWLFRLPEQKFSLIMTDNRFYITWCPNLTDFGMDFELNA